MEKIEMPERIEAKRLALVRPYPVTFELAREIFQEVETSRKTLAPWLPWVAKTKTVEDEFLDFLTSWALKNWDGKKGFAYTIREKDTNRFLGVVDLFNIDKESASAEIGFWLSDNAVGRGYMTEAVRALEKVGFEAGVHRIQICNDTENARSIAVAKRRGYHLDGVLRDRNWSNHFQAYRSHNVWSKLKEEWETEQKGE